jgi:Alcohol dehydrogenase, class IV
LPRAVADGSDVEAREKMHNAATLAGLGLGNSQAALAHALGHSVGALFRVPHGRAVSVCLPYTIEYTSNAGLGRYLDLVRSSACRRRMKRKRAACSPAPSRGLMRQIGQPERLADCGVPEAEFRAQLEALCDRAELDTCLIVARRIPERDELRRLFLCAYDGTPVDF